MTPDERQAQQPVLFYAEDRSAIRWPYYFCITLFAVLLIASVIPGVITDDPNWSAPMVITFMALVLSVAFAIQNWPVGIRVDSGGIRIGAVRRKPNRPGRQPWSDYQRWQEMFAPWEAVRSIAVIEDKAGLRDARKLGNRYMNRVGVLTAPFTRAVLLIEVDPAHAVVPDFREPDEKLPFFRPGHRTPFMTSPVWYVPTRRPDALRQTLVQHIGSLGGQPTPYLPPYLRLLFERAGVAQG